MATYSGYTFNNLSRLGLDDCNVTQTDMQNVAECNYMTQNFFASDCTMKSARELATSQPGIMYNGTYQTAFLSNLTTNYQGVARYKMLITGSGNLGVEFQMLGSGNMTGGQNYVLTSGIGTTTPYAPVTAANNLLNLPPDPTNLSLLISEIGDPSNSTTNFVELYNAGATSIDFSLCPWYLSFNAGSSVQLTGTLAAGAKYTVAYDNVDFSPNLVSTLVGTGGTTNYLLSVFGDYSNGSAKDVYNGATTSPSCSRYRNTSYPQHR